MLDYAHWLIRAESFIRDLHRLPGQWGMCVEHKMPPLSIEDAGRVDQSLSLGLPEPLREFYTSASAGCCYTYDWESDIVGDILSDRTVHGGPNFIHASDLPNMLELAHSWVHDILIEQFTDEYRPLLDRWLTSVPFVAIGNGDYLALCAESTTDSMPVVYLSHDDPEHPVTSISRTFEEFMLNWERLHYIGPEMWLLCNFFNGKDSQLNPDGSKAKAWRELVARNRR